MNALGITSGRPIASGVSVPDDERIDVVERQRQQDAVLGAHQFCLDEGEDL
ncbi:MAG: hypothetical protein U1E33_08710 [Rhodospirillales bacterium]